MEKTSYLCPRTLRRWQLGFTCCKFGCLSGGGGATSWKIITSVCCYSELPYESTTFEKETKSERISCKRLCVKHGRDLSGFCRLVVEPVRHG